MQYEIRAMTFAEILDTAFRLITNHFVLLVGLMAVANLPTALLATYVTPNGGDQVTPEEVWLMAGGFGLILILFSILYPIALAATTHAIGELYRGREVGFAEALRFGTSNLMPLVGTWILVTLFVALGFLCLVLPGVYLALSLVAVWPIMIIERIYGMRAIRRSRELMHGNLMRVLGIFLVVALIGGVVGAGVGLALGWIPGVNVLANPLIQSTSAAFGTAAQVVLYFEVRCRKEGFDIEHLAERVELQGEAGAAGI